MFKTVISGLAVASALGFAASPATAATTILTFAGDICGTGAQACTGSNFVSQSYGDGTGVNVSYRGANPNTNSTTSSSLWIWNGGYGDLTTVAYAGSGSNAEILINALSGYEIRFLRFDAGCYLNRASCQSIGYQLTELGGGSTFGTVTPPANGHSTAVFQTGYSTTGYRLRFGPDAYNGGISNIAFDVRAIGAAVPEPSAWALLILGFGLAGGAMRRRTRTKLAFG